MTNSPAHEKEDPLVGKAGADAGAPKQQTGAEQRPGVSFSFLMFPSWLWKWIRRLCLDASGTKKDQSGSDAPGDAGISDSAIKVCLPS